MPPSVTYVSDDSGGSYIAPTWTIGDLDNGECISLEITGTINSIDEDIVNTVTVTSDTEDPGLDNNTSIDTVEISTQLLPCCDTESADYDPTKAVWIDDNAFVGSDNSANPEVTFDVTYAGDGSLVSASLDLCKVDGTIKESTTSFPFTSTTITPPSGYGDTFTVAKSETVGSNGLKTERSEVWWTDSDTGEQAPKVMFSAIYNADGAFESGKCPQNLTIFSAVAAELTDRVSLTNHMLTYGGQSVDISAHPSTIDGTTGVAMTNVSIEPLAGINWLELTYDINTPDGVVKAYHRIELNASCS